MPIIKLQRYKVTYKPIVVVAIDATEAEELAGEEMLEVDDVEWLEEY